MAMRLVPPQLSDDESVSNQDDSTDLFFDDGSSDLTQASVSNPDSVAGHIYGQDTRTEDDHAWLTSDEMAILRIIGGEPCRANLSNQRPHGLKRLPVGTKPVKLIGEGAANAVFEIKVPPRHGAGGHDFKGFLLRVAKVPFLGAKPTYNYLLQQKFLQTAIKPMLGDHVVHQELVVLHKSGIVQELNNLLRDINHTRKDKFKGTYVGETNWGFLVEDMRPQDPNSCVLVEFKPKWLSQSPSAPRDAVRCRQCALELRHAVQDLSRSKAHPERKPCPLALISSDCPRQVCSPFRVAPHLANKGNDEFYAEALRDVANHSAIRTLKTQQDIHDTLGPLSVSPSDSFFPLAMTLRDCTCFAQIDERTQAVRLRFGDFDWKDPQVKFEKWRNAEQELVENGWYTSQWILCDGVFYRPPTLCLLEHQPAALEKRPEVILIKGNGGGDEASLSRIPKGVKVHQCKTDVGTLQKILEPHKAETPDFFKA